MESTESDVTGWVGWIVFAAVLMVMMGVFGIIGGLIAIFDDSYTSGPLGEYANSTANAWGWSAIINAKPGCRLRRLATVLVLDRRPAAAS